MDDTQTDATGAPEGTKEPVAPEGAAAPAESAPTE